jgi:hypothetical protein
VHLLPTEILPTDVHQGSLGDCWFLSAVACVAARRELIEQLFQFSDESAGCYVVRFYKDGKNVDVGIDDFFPLAFGTKPLFADSGTREKVWVQVLEKAYAKLHGSFAAIDGGYVQDALVDLTGGSGNTLQLHSDEGKGQVADGSFWAKLRKIAAQGHLLGAGSNQGSDTDKDDGGIVLGHAYSILRVEEIAGLQLLQLMNPWGGSEWTGKWSDGDSGWTPTLKEQLGYESKEDGVFWMAFSDFLLHFSNIYVCRIFGAGWNRQRVAGAWKGASAGGSRFEATFKNNPSYIITLTESINEVYIFLAQSDSRGHDEKGLYVTSTLFSEDGKRLLERSSWSRELKLELDLIPQAYRLVVSTWKPMEEAEFTVTVCWQGDAKLLAFTEGKAP